MVLYKKDNTLIKCNINSILICLKSFFYNINIWVETTLKQNSKIEISLY